MLAVLLCLQNHLETLLGAPASKMRIFYIDTEMKEVFGREELRFNQKPLYSYNIRDGDELHIELKMKTTVMSSSV